MSSPDFPPQPDDSSEQPQLSQEPDLLTHEGQLTRVQQLEAQRRAYEASQPDGHPLDADPDYQLLLGRLVEARSTLTAHAARAAVEQMTNPSST